MGNNETFPFCFVCSCVEMSYLKLGSYLVSIKDFLRTKENILRMVEEKDAEFRSLWWMLGCAA